MANNSAVYDFEGGVPVEVFMEEWLALVKSKSGERGIFNRKAAEALPGGGSGARQARVQPVRGDPPAAAPVLQPVDRGGPPDDTRETLRRKVRLATIFGKIQSTRHRLQLHPRRVEELRGGAAPGRGHHRPRRLPAAAVRDTPAGPSCCGARGQGRRGGRHRLSGRFGINRSAADTCVKPAGDSAVFFDCARGSARGSPKYQIRWVRESKDSPVAKFLIEAGVPHADAPEAPNELYVFGFPKKAPEGRPCGTT
jgi:ribonucleoside-triphosphate reductase